AEASGDRDEDARNGMSVSLWKGSIIVETWRSAPSERIGGSWIWPTQGRLLRRDQQKSIFNEIIELELTERVLKSLPDRHGLRRDRHRRVHRPPGLLQSDWIDEDGDAVPEDAVRGHSLDHL